MTSRSCTARRIITGVVILFFGAAASTACLGDELESTVRRSAGSEKWLAKDKVLHFGLSFALALGGAAGLRDLGMAERDSPAWAGGSVLSLGIFKELAFDRGRREGRASWQDVVADLAGVIAAWYAWDAATKQ